VLGIGEDYFGCPNPMDPASAYGLGKRAAEHLCALYSQAYRLETVIARCFAFVGPDLPLDAHFAVGNFIRDALWADAIRVSGDGSPIRSYMDQTDLARWLMELLQRGVSGQAYNVGSPDAISIADLAYLVRDTIAPEKQVHILGKHVENDLRSRYIPDVSKARRELGLSNSVPLCKAIACAASAWV
jgi:dTDP-glucose 4,6-dehydratase